MTYITNNGMPAAALNQGSAPAKTGPGFWQRLFAAMVESRRRSALRELRAYHYRLKEMGIGELSAQNSDLPFKG